VLCVALGAAVAVTGVDASGGWQTGAPGGGDVVYSHVAKGAAGSLGNVAEKVINGAAATDIKQFPSVAALYGRRGEQFQFVCTASLLDDRLALTAAHCLELPADVSRLVCYGNVEMDSSRGECKVVTESAVHPTWDLFVNQTATGYDVAIMRLEGAFEDARATSGILSTQVYGPGTRVVAVGYGTSETETKDGNSGALRFADLVVQRREYCTFNRGLLPEQYRRRYLCTTGDFDGSGGGICHGDSGGPLYVRLADNSLLQVAIASAVELTVQEKNCETVANEQQFLPLHIPQVAEFINETVSRFNGRVFWERYTPSPDDVPDGDTGGEPGDNSGGEPTPRPDSESGPESPACFPADATVLLATGITKRMDQLEAGHRVLIGPHSFSDVIGFTHRLRGVPAEFIRICAQGKCVEMSPGHYAFVNGALQVASLTRSGDTMMRADNTVVRVDTVDRVVKRGLYNPQTMDGNIAVNGYVVSTYTRALEPHVAHVLLWVPRVLYRIGVQDPLGPILYGDIPQWMSRLLPRGRAAESAAAFHLRS